VTSRIRPIFADLAFTSSGSISVGSVRQGHGQLFIGMPARSITHSTTARCMISCACAIPRIFIGRPVMGRWRCALLSGCCSTGGVVGGRYGIRDRSPHCDAQRSRHLDSTLATTYTGRIVFAGLCDKPFDIDQQVTIVPRLATGYEWSDSQTLRIYLRQGVKFHDGRHHDGSCRGKGQAGTPPDDGTQLSPGGDQPDRPHRGG
jgi:hypothetical protein